MEEICIDVSELAPPEPMTQILKALSQLNTSQYLKVIHRRKPFPLFEKLEANGWGFECQKKSPECFHLYIYRLAEKPVFECLKGQAG